MEEQLFTVDELNHNLRLDIFLSRALQDISSRTYVKKAIEKGQVTLNKKSVKAHHKVHCGDEVTVKFSGQAASVDDIQPEPIPLEIFYEDNKLLVVNKPIGMLVHPVYGCGTGTLVNALLHHCNNLSDINSLCDEDPRKNISGFRPGIVHRLDKETSGLLVVAKDNQTHVRLARQFEKHKVQKRYLALVRGAVEFDEGIVEVPLGKHHSQFDKRAVSFDDHAKKATTFYRVIKRKAGELSLVALFPKSGRTHQLRVHMAYLGHPILGDAKYGSKSTFFRMALHAQGLGFFHPESKKFIEFLSVTPKDFLDPFEN